MASVLNGRQQYRKDWTCKSTNHSYNVVERCNGEFVEFDLRITWNELTAAITVVHFKLNKAVSPIVLLY